ncbi:MAG TPA: S53 family peptidase [Casimicrobiaceae bacterium]|nr:S53 family peptidase [Casimicrobiaceae bacterium]
MSRIAEVCDHPDSTYFQKEYEMVLERSIQIICRACLCALGVFVVSQSALAAGAQRTMSVRLDTQETSAGAGPQYGLFTCQVGLASIPGRQCYDPYQMRHAYGVDALIAAGYDGTGHNIVIVDAFQNPNLVSQIATYNAFYGLPPTNLTQIAPDGLTPFVPGDPNMTGWAEEISLDVEWAHAIAPGANIVLVLAKSNNDPDILSAVTYAVNNNLGDVISMSFGENESCVDPTILSAYHDVFAAATQKGITLFASSGDQGAAQPTCDGNSWALAASSPASDPLVTAVGGTELRAADFCLTVLGCNPATHPSPGTWQSEIAWNEGPPYGDFQPFFGSTLATGGGFSVLFDEPPWQKSQIKDDKVRGVPDVAYNAAVLHGVLTYLNIPGLVAGFYTFGGTSAGSPQWSAITAIANQKNGGRLGFLSKAIYQIGKSKKAYPASFHDITSGVNSAVEFDSSNNPVNIVGFSAGAGWDATTGFGSPINPSLVDNLISGVSPGDAQSAISTTKPKPHPKPIVPGHADPH